MTGPQHKQTEKNTTSSLLSEAKRFCKILPDICFFAGIALGICILLIDVYPRSSAYRCPLGISILLTIGLFSSKIKYRIIALILTVFMAYVTYTTYLHGIKYKPFETNTTIKTVFVRIHLYARISKTMPASLDELPERRNYYDTLKDAWGRKLHYQVNENGMVTVFSLGEDGKLGGTGNDADISQSYYYKRPDGSFWAGDEYWPADAKVE
jgi:hypothetical protein